MACIELSFRKETNNSSTYSAPTNSDKSSGPYHHFLLLLLLSLATAAISSRCPTLLQRRSLNHHLAVMLLFAILTSCCVMNRTMLMFVRVCNVSNLSWMLCQYCMNPPCIIVCWNTCLTCTNNIRSNYSQTSYSRKGLTHLKSTVANDDSPPIDDPPFEQSSPPDVQPALHDGKIILSDSHKVKDDALAYKDMSFLVQEDGIERWVLLLLFYF